MPKQFDQQMKNGKKKEKERKTALGRITGVQPLWYNQDACH